MRAVVQRVKSATVTVDHDTVGEIGLGLLVLLGVGPTDSEKTAQWMARKLVKMRIFSDPAGKFNHSISEVGGEMLIVSQFTLYGDVSRGNRPSFTQAAPPDWAEQLYECVCTEVQALGVSVSTGQFGAMMQVALINDGPVTIIVEQDESA